MTTHERFQLTNLITMGISGVLMSAGYAMPTYALDTLIAVFFGSFFLAITYFAKGDQR